MFGPPVAETAPCPPPAGAPGRRAPPRNVGSSTRSEDRRPSTSWRGPWGRRRPRAARSWWRRPSGATARSPPAGRPRPCGRSCRARRSSRRPRVSCGQAARRRAPGPPRHPAAGGQSPLLANLARVAESARLRDVPEQEVRGLRRAVQAEAAKVVRPSEIAEVVGELDPTERDALTEVLIQTGLVPEEHREVLEAAVRPGGYSDKLAGATAWVALARRYAFVAVALPLVELLLSFICGRLVCHVPLAGWLRTDAGLGLLTACASGFGAYLLSPAYAILQKDPIATVQRALAAKSSSPEEHAPGSQPLLAQPPTMVARLDADLRPVLEAAVPGVPYDDFRRAALCLAVALVLFVLGTLWTVVGLVELLAAGGCSVLLVRGSANSHSCSSGCAAWSSPASSVSFSTFTRSFRNIKSARTARRSQ
ncbi:unnamed protein product [Prorocentrum cordatum]|uniref:Uncharacterized protein n=2 Tax=Prorocentrum cordatum TaxID=2364126 RepID=A0ABN9WYA8_9DINO|nr:unnamed protein product [Polarella glacialis]